MGVGRNGSNRVLRGGSWINDAQNVRSAYRNPDHPSKRNSNYGFRVAREQERAGRPAPDPTPIPAASLMGAAKTERSPACW